MAEPKPAILLDVDAAAGRRRGWHGIAMFEGRLYCCPAGAATVLVIDPARNSAVSTIALPGGGGTWRGIAACGGHLYCAPSTASAVLVIDPKKGSATRIESGGAVTKARQWDGIAVCGGFLYCAPHDAAGVLVVDARTSAMRTLECAPTANVHAGSKGKWAGAASARGRIYCAPYNADCVLVVDPGARETVRSVPVGDGSRRKWSGACACRGRVFFAPHDHGALLVIDPRDDSTRLIDAFGAGPYASICASGDRLFCAPSRGSTPVLAVTPGLNGVDDEDGVKFIPTDHAAGAWAGVCVANGSVYAAPAGSGAVLVVDRDAGAPPLETRLLGYVNGLSAFACAGGNGAATCAMPNVPSVPFAVASDGGADGGAGFDPLAPPIPRFHFEEPLENDWGAGGAASAPEHEIDEEHAPLLDARTAFAAGEDRRRGPPPDEDGGDGPGDDGPPPPPPPPYAILGEGAVASQAFLARVKDEVARCKAEVVEPKRTPRRS